MPPSQQQDPNGAGTRPSAHEAAGFAIEHSIQPLETNGTVNPSTGRIGLPSIGMSNVTLDWAVAGPNHFTFRATNGPSLNPRVFVRVAASADRTRWTGRIW